VPNLAVEGTGFPCLSHYGFHGGYLLWRVKDGEVLAHEFLRGVAVHGCKGTVDIHQGAVQESQGYALGDLFHRRRKKLQSVSRLLGLGNVDEGCLYEIRTADREHPVACLDGPYLGRRALVLGLKGTASVLQHFLDVLGHLLGNLIAQQIGHLLGNLIAQQIGQPEPCEFLPGAADKLASRLVELQHSARPRVGDHNRVRRLLEGSAEYLLRLPKRIPRALTTVDVNRRGCRQSFLHHVA